MATATDACGKRLLIVEDDPNMALLLREEFEDDGYTVQVAYGGREALSAVTTNPPDVVILDVNMPGKDGIETLNDIVNARGNVPVVLHTAYSAYKDNYMTWAAAEYVVKSGDLSELKDAVTRALRTGGPHNTVPTVL